MKSISKQPHAAICVPRTNDHADDRVQWGKGDGPYCRFALDGSYEGDPKKAEALPTSASQSILTAVKACECIRQCVMRRYSDTSIVSNIFDVQMVSGATLPAFNVLRGAEAKRGGTWLSKTKVLQD